MLKLRFSGRLTDIPIVRAREEVQYELDLTNLLSCLLDPALTPDVDEVPKVVMKKVVLLKVETKERYNS